jgi:hypothetical protein
MAVRTIPERRKQAAIIVKRQLTFILLYCSDWQLEINPSVQEEQKLFNSELSKERIVIENINAWIKNARIKTFKI